MSLSRPIKQTPATPHSKQYVGRDKPVVQHITGEVHWYEMYKIKPPSTTPREPYERGDSHQNRWDMDLEPIRDGE